jgi:trehalose 6-phosphate phosphatase
VDRLAPFADDPRGTGVFLDVDGTLAPIAPHPDLVVVPVPARELLDRLAGRYAVVACVSGRRVADVRALVGPAPLVIGCHGMEEEGGFVADVAPWLPAIARAAAALRPVADASGAWIEDKVAALNVHFREAPDPAAAGAALEAAAAQLPDPGLLVRSARMSLEVLPPVHVDKGTAVTRIVRERGLRRSLYAGDDTTDISALRVVDLPIAIRSPESPAALLAAAEIVVDGPAGLLELLERL